MEIGKRITQLRGERGVTVNKLANMAGISQSYLRDIELGNKQPTVEYLSYICDALGVSLQYFFTEEPFNDRILHAVYKLSPEQRERLADFLEKL